MMACKHGHTQVVRMLIERGTESDKCYYENQSPVLTFERGHAEILKINRCDYIDQASVIKACDHVHRKKS